MYCKTKIDIVLKFDKLFDLCQMNPKTKKYSCLLYFVCYNCLIYTLLPNTRRSRCRVPLPPPHPTVHLRTVKSNIGRLCFVGKRIYRRLRLFRYLKNISILPLYESYQTFTLFFDCAIIVTSHISMRFYF